MRTILFSSLVIAALYLPGSAGRVSFVFGPLENDSAAIITARGNETIELEVWVRTSPGTNIVALDLPLSSNDLYVRSDSRAGGELYYPFTMWTEAMFLDPVDDPINDGYTAQSILGLKDLGLEEPSPDDGLNTNGAWWRVGVMFMTTVETVDNEIHYDAFTDGFWQCGGGVVMVDYYIGEMSKDSIEFSFAPLLLTEPVSVIRGINPPGRYSLGQNFPNPFNARTNIRYNLPQESGVRIEIFDILGRKIATLVDGVQTAGSYSLIWDAGNEPSGIYFYKIAAGEFTETRRALLLK